MQHTAFRNAILLLLLPIMACRPAGCDRAPVTAPSAPLTPTAAVAIEPAPTSEGESAGA